MILGFTGTRKGLSAAQRAALPSVLATLPERVLHGGCVGADRDFHYFIVSTVKALSPYQLDDRGIVLPKACLIEIFPAYMDQFRWAEHAFKEDIPLVALIRPSNGNPFARNRIIAARCDALLACPAEATEQLRSGTWSTVRYARKAGKLITIIAPDGTAREERP
jgi:hypothetical protein